MNFKILLRIHKEKRYFFQKVYLEFSNFNIPMDFLECSSSSQRVATLPVFSCSWNKGRCRSFHLHYPVVTYLGSKRLVSFVKLKTLNSSLMDKSAYVTTPANTMVLRRFHPLDAIAKQTIEITINELSVFINHERRIPPYTKRIIENLIQYNGLSLPKPHDFRICNMDF